MYKNVHTISYAREGQVLAKKDNAVAQQLQLQQSPHVMQGCHVMHGYTATAAQR
jgi:hypothetical protein